MVWGDKRKTAHVHVQSLGQEVCGTGKRRFQGSSGRVHDFHQVRVGRPEDSGDKLQGHYSDCQQDGHQAKGHDFKGTDLLYLRKRERSGQRRIQRSGRQGKRRTTTGSHSLCECPPGFRQHSFRLKAARFLLPMLKRAGKAETPPSSLHQAGPC